MVVAGGGIGGWNGFVSIGWIIYVVIVFVVEVFVPEFYVHRLIVSIVYTVFPAIIFFAQDAIIAIVYAVVFAVAVLICIIFAAITTVTAAKGLLAAGVVSTTLYCCFHSTYLCCYRYLVLYVVVLLVPVQHLLFTHGVHTKEEPKDLVPSFSYSHYQHKIIIQTQ